ncbi:DUF2165 domain-containing protein [Bifidobacterium sp. ESL0790]|uniref:DUF2165 family protein n=1 Tax=Bifidobacterium sp. ESL0790 TaxID=2983233 RepID=UPI0023F83619|nr:DUF2165 domain-containing protein [Bifidobacterium sp. ESL0790]WEV72111.1 DUF2165 domain-containing protein [Bifidobacterium sp. ESL0790]
MTEAKVQKWMKILVVFMFATFAFFVFIGNLMDFGSNYDFVQHVLSMDTTFPGNSLMWRALPYHWVWLVAYWFLIILEGVIALAGYISVYKMIRVINKGDEEFSKAKTFGYIMFALAIVLWYGGFAIVGSEWFAMWQSKVWNGKQTAMDITEVAVAFLVVFMLPLVKSGSKKIEETAEKVTKD